MNKKLVGFITASVLENNFTADLILSMKESGVDSLELGIPFSDPVADGPIIEKANLIALKNNFSLESLFDLSKMIALNIDTLWMGYMNPFFHFGIENILQKAQEINLNGFIIPDLPFEESILYKNLFEKYNQPLINFITPLNDATRIKMITKDAKKFIYLVAYAGITGNGTSEDLTQIITNIRRSSKTQIYLGFGVNEYTAKQKVKNVDGVIVGSAFIKHLIDDTLSYNEKLKNITSMASRIKSKINE